MQMPLQQVSSTAIPSRCLPLILCSASSTALPSTPFFVALQCSCVALVQPLGCWHHSVAWQSPAVPPSILPLRPLLLLIALPPITCLVFARVCGIHSFYVPRSNPDGYAVTAHCIDSPTVASLTIKTFDGQNWEASYGSSGIAACSAGNSGGGAGSTGGGNG